MAGPPANQIKHIEDAAPAALSRFLEASFRFPIIEIVCFYTITLLQSLIYVKIQV